MVSCVAYHTNRCRGAVRREHVLPVERDARHVRQIEAELGNKRRQMRPALRVGIAPERSEAATGHRRRNARLKRRREQRLVSAVRVPDAADALRVHHRQRLQEVNLPACIPNHLAHERPARVLAIECEAIVVRLFAGGDAFAEADGIRCEADVASLH